MDTEATKQSASRREEILKKLKIPLPNHEAMGAADRGPTTFSDEELLKEVHSRGLITNPGNINKPEMDLKSIKDPDTIDPNMPTTDFVPGKAARNANISI